MSANSFTYGTSGFVSERDKSRTIYQLVQVTMNKVRGTNGKISAGANTFSPEDNQGSGGYLITRGIKGMPGDIGCKIKGKDCP